MQKSSKIGQETKKLQKMGNDVIVTSFLYEYFLLIPIDVPSFKLIEGQIKELKGVVPNTPPGWEWPKKPAQDRIKDKENFAPHCKKYLKFYVLAKLYH